jgi:hypothetical protein
MQANRPRLLATLSIVREALNQSNTTLQERKERT